MFLSKRTEFDEVVLFAVLQSGSGGSVPYLVMKFSKAEPEIRISLVGADTIRLRREWEERSRAKSWRRGGVVLGHRDSILQSSYGSQVENCTLQPLGRNKN